VPNSGAVKAVTELNCHSHWRWTPGSTRRSRLADWHSCAPGRTVLAWANHHVLACRRIQESERARLSRPSSR